MEKVPPMQHVDEIPHERICPMHQDEGIKVCWGRLKKGEPCANKAVPSGIPDDVPTCGVHRRLAQKSATCFLQLPCGFQCKRLCVFQVHGFQLCDLHQDTSTACYLMKIPVELRQRIYGYLLPSKPIPARLSSSGPASLVWLEILRANRKIHEECIQLLYGKGSFVIEICKDGLSMCYSSATPENYEPPPRIVESPAGAGNFAMQCYQMQMMLLEQQNKERLRKRREQREANGGSSQAARIREPPVNGLMSSPPPLSPAHFNMIRSFVIEIIIDDSQQIANYYDPNEPNSPEMLEKSIFDYCDHLHKLVGRLQLQSLSRLQIKIGFGATYNRWEDAAKTAKFLLRPFRRLRNVSQADVISITIQVPENDELEIVSSLSNYVHHWSLDLKSSTPPEQSPIFEAYWQLEDMISTLQNHCSGDKKLEPLEYYLHSARIAREDNDREAFGVIWGQIVDIYMGYVNNQKFFQTNMAMTIDRINGLLVGGPP